MNIQRRTFLSIASALGLSLAAPSLSRPQGWTEAEVNKAFGLTNEPERGLYALIAFHRNMAVSPFSRVSKAEVDAVFAEHAVRDGDFNWVKLPLVRKASGLGDPCRPYAMPGGQMSMYAGYKILHCVGGVPFEVTKNKITGDMSDMSAPDILHTLQIPMLHPVNNAFNPEKARGEILVHSHI